MESPRRPETGDGWLMLTSAARCRFGRTSAKNSSAASTSSTSSSPAAVKLVLCNKYHLQMLPDSCISNIGGLYSETYIGRSMSAKYLRAAIPYPLQYGGGPDKYVYLVCPVPCAFLYKFVVSCPFFSLFV